MVINAKINQLLLLDNMLRYHENYINGDFSKVEYLKNKRGVIGKS